MSKKLEEIDQLIKDTLSKEEAEFYDSLEQQSLFEMIFGLFKGKNSWFLIIVNILILCFLGLLVYCTINFFSANLALEEMIKWGFGVVILFITVSVLKIYAWMQMDKNAILREMKRLELQVMSVSSKLEGDSKVK